MILVFHPTTKKFLFHTGKCSGCTGDNQPQLLNNKDNYMESYSLSEEDWHNKIEVVLEDTSDEVRQIIEGYIPTLTQAGKLSKTMEKGARLLAKESKIAEKEVKETRLAEIDNELKKEKTLEEKVALLIEKVDKMTK